MREVRLNQTEASLVKKLAELFEQGQTQVAVSADDETDKSLGLTPENVEAVLGTLQHIGAISELWTGDGGRAFTFIITPVAVQAARAVREQETEAAKPKVRDIVAEMKETARGNRLLAWAIIAFIVLTAAITFVNQLLELLKKFGLFQGP
jgi:hypothetical protein